MGHLGLPAPGNEYGPDGTTPRQDQRLARMVLNARLRERFKGQRIPTEATLAELEELQRERHLDAQEKLAMVLHSGLDSTVPDIQQKAAANTIKAISLNQKDELDDGGSGKTQVQVNVGITNEMAADGKERRVAEIEAELRRRGLLGDSRPMGAPPDPPADGISGDSGGAV